MRNFAPHPETQPAPRYDGQVNRGHQISVNGDPHEVPDDCTLERLLGMLEMQHRRVAVAINRGIVPRTRYGAIKIEEGDRIEILEAVGGG